MTSTTVPSRVACPCGWRGWRGYRVRPDSRDCPRCGGDRAKIEALWLAGQGPGRWRAYLVCWAADRGELPDSSHADHYLGSTTDLPGRIAAHEDGRGARVTANAVEHGATLVLARTWDRDPFTGGTAREFELRHKQRKSAPSPRTRTGKRRGANGSLRRLCPICKERARARREEG